jgi:DNA-binding transcriptional ArsR family regulator
MSQKHKRGLQRGLSDIVEKQTAPVEDKKRESADLISRFSEPKPAPLPPPPPTTSYHQPPPTNSETAPKRDFARVPNSITRDAMPAGLFKGTSKKLYDALYLRTRGAIQPMREIKARQSELMLWAQVSHNTLRAHLRHLEAAGLVIRKWELGDNDGAVYEVFIPEELPA